MSKKHDKDFLMSRKYATFVANEYAKRIEKAIELLEHFDSGQQCEHTKDLAIIVKKILQGEDKDE